MGVGRIRDSYENPRQSRAFCIIVEKKGERVGGGGGGVTVVPSVSFAVLKNNKALNGRVLSLYGPRDQRLRIVHKDCTELHPSLRSQ